MALGRRISVRNGGTRISNEGTFETEDKKSAVSEGRARIGRPEGYRAEQRAEVVEKAELRNNCLAKTERS